MLAIFDAEEGYVVGYQRMQAVDRDELFCEAVRDAIMVDV